MLTVYRSGRRRDSFGHSHEVASAVGGIRMDTDRETVSLKTTSSRSGTLRLVVFVGDGSQVLPLPDRGALSIGRGKGVDLRLDDQTVSSRHIKVHVLGDSVRVEDLGSTNGTRVRGRDLGRGETVELQSGDAVEIGRTLLVLQRSGSSQTRRVRLYSHDDFVSRIEDECGRAERANGQFAVLRIRAPESAAATAGERLAGAIQPGDVLGEYGPGEYEVLLVDCDSSLAEARARRLAGSMSAGRKLAEFGMAIFPADGRTPASLLEKANAALRGTVPPRDTDAPVLFRGGPMEEVLRLLDRAASRPINVLILGPTGVGKGVLAAELHRRSPRASGPFVALNCAEFAESLLEAELFGYERGAFTGAAKAKPGLIESADGGTLFLDEIGEMPPTLQAKLLKLLDDRLVRRLGSVKPTRVDIRLVSATNRNLEAEIKAGRFKEDLYFRINGIPVQVPPLRERLEEIGVLARLFLEQEAQQAGQPVPELTPEAMAALRSYSWPGNVRELRNAMERAAVLCADGVITPNHLPAEEPLSTVYAETPAPRDERERIHEALVRCAWNQTKAAQELKISRRTLVNRLKKYKFPRPRDRS
jgi:two-component system, NtrC family, response regulator AtoC